RLHLVCKCLSSVNIGLYGPLGTAVCEVEDLHSAIPTGRRAELSVSEKRRGASAVHEYVLGDLPLLLVQVKHRTLQYAVGVGTAGVHGQGPTELGHAPALVDVPVHGQHRGV